MTRHTLARLAESARFGSATPAGTVRLVPVLLLGLLLLAGCESSTEPGPPERVTFDAIVLVGVLEGPDTFFLDVIGSTDAYYPVNLPQEFQVEGARVRVEGLLQRGIQVLLHPVVEILSIEALPE